jgi:hypothetical protein
MAHFCTYDTIFGHIIIYIRLFTLWINILYKCIHMCMYVCAFTFMCEQYANLILD